MSPPQRNASANPSGEKQKQSSGSGSTGKVKVKPILAWGPELGKFSHQAIRVLGEKTLNPTKQGNTASKQTAAT